MTEKYEVSVITNTSPYQENKKHLSTNFTISDEIQIVKVISKKRNKNKLSQRTLKFISLSLKLFKLLLNKTRNGDKVLIVTNPAPFLVLCPIIKKIKKIKLFILIHDIFPENTIPPGIIKSPKNFIYKLISFIFNKAYSEADCLIVLGRDMKEVISRKIKKNHNKPRIEIIENWGDIKNICPIETIPSILLDRHVNNSLTIQYAGNIGRLQGLNYFIDLLNCTPNKRIYFDILGNGAIKETLIKQVDNYELQDRIHFYDSYSRNEQNSILNSTDIALVTLSKGMYGLGVPSKTYNILAAGKPILFIGDLQSEIALLIKEEKIGFCFSTEDTQGIIRFLNNFSMEILPLLKKMGHKARVVAETKYSEDIILAKFLNAI
jgi:glycosyltransferase involved in cell wall biosynthesis